MASQQLHPMPGAVLSLTSSLIFRLITYFESPCPFVRCGLVLRYIATRSRIIYFIHSVNDNQMTL